MIRRTAWVLVLALVAGCSTGGVRRYQLSGTITHDGKPVPNGTLLFEPDTAKGNKGPGVQVEIENGRYQTPPGKGVVGGPHIVRIVGYDGKGDARGESHRGRPFFREQVRSVDLPYQDATRDFEISAETK